MINENAGKNVNFSNSINSNNINGINYNDD